MCDSNNNSSAVPNDWPTAKVGADGKVETFFDPGLCPSGDPSETFYEIDDLANELVDATVAFLRHGSVYAEHGEELVSVMADAAKLLPYNRDDAASILASNFLNGLVGEIACDGPRPR